MISQIPNKSFLVITPALALSILLDIEALREQITVRAVKRLIYFLITKAYTDKANKISAILHSTNGRKLAADIVEITIAVGISHLDPELI